MRIMVIIFSLRQQIQPQTCLIKLTPSDQFKEETEVTTEPAVAKQSPKSTFDRSILNTLRDYNHDQ